MSASVATLLIQHQIEPGAELRYEAWLNEIVPVAQRFIGHLGVNIIRPVGGSGTYTIVLRFDNFEHLQDWLESAVRKRFIEQIEPILVAGDQIEIKTGLEFWFTPEEVGQKHAAPFKQFLITLSVIFPLTLVVPQMWKPVFHALPWLSMTVPSNFVVAATIVFLVVYIIMPRYTRLAAKWLYS